MSRKKRKTTELEIKNGEERDVCIMDEFEMLFRLNKFKKKKKVPFKLESYRTHVTRLNDKLPAAAAVVFVACKGSNVRWF